MSWLKKISQKPMALPVSLPESHRRDYAGINRMDNRMSQETSNKLLNEYPEIEYAGAGAIGIAFQTGPNEIMKITHDFNEYNIASYVYKHPMDWVVPILEEPKMIQESPPMWRIRMKKLHLIEDLSLRNFITFISESKAPDPNLVKLIIETEFYDRQDEAMDIYAAVKHIMKENSRTFWLEDIHGENVGWDDDGRLKVFDFGPPWFEN